MQYFYNFSGGMESAAMLVVDSERIKETGAMVRWANTGKQFPEMAASIAQIERALGFKIVEVPNIKTFDDYLFQTGPKGGHGMLRRGIPECSQVMKRRPLMHHAKTFPKPWEINLGFNSDELERAEAFTDRNERPDCHWRFPLIEAGVSRPATRRICEEAGFTVLVDMYRKMGRFDCFWCPNQQPRQALKVAQYYPELAREWMAAEERKGHSFMPLPLKVMIEESKRQRTLFESDIQCACFGGTDDMWQDD